MANDGPANEFELIARLFRPLAKGAPEALDLLDDAAVIPSRPGFDLVVTKDAVVAGVHFLPEDPLDLIARKLLRVNLSDLAAKGAQPYGYFLAVAWPTGCPAAHREAFARGLAEDQGRFGVKLFGGDTVSTSGPLTASVTMLGWVPEGAMVKRSGARPGDVLLVSGTIGDGGLGLRAARRELAAVSEQGAAWLADRYRLPWPRLELAPVLRRHASAAADVSDGLLADAGHIGEASGVGVAIDLARLPLSAAAAEWIAGEQDPRRGRATLASLGDDYEVVCTAPPEHVGAMIAEAAEAGVRLTVIGTTAEPPGLSVTYRGAPVEVPRTGWKHG